ncbi:MAG: DEAD/DEAH box helicase family protein [Clostridia bacterium]|nr:DEAD/DEAH box helicase family protein [Clostridia bacterium]
MKQIHYQEEAIQYLSDKGVELLKSDENGTVLLKAPTGSGKTYIMCRTIESIIDDYNEECLCFIWASKSILIDQSIRSIKKYIGDKVICSKATPDYCNGKNYLDKNEILCVSWESTNEFDKDTGEPNNKLTKKQEKNNLYDILENTRKRNAKIVLIIDECHAMSNTENAIKLKDEIYKANLTFEMSATPCLEKHLEHYKYKKDITVNEVMAEHMIKKEVIINCDIDDIKENVDSQKVILEKAFQKREKLKRAYELEGENINPLVIIQIKNAELGEENKESILGFLREKGKTIANGKVKVWLSESSLSKEEKEELSKNDNEIEFLIFKISVKEGWDCPRAQILVRFREVKSISFDIQTVGRILRMPNAKHYDNEILNTAYIYTNINHIIIKKEEFLKNIIKSKRAIRKDIYTYTPLRSYYKKRIDFGDITSTYVEKRCFETKFCQEFDIKLIDNNDEELKKNYKNNIKKLKQHNIKIDDNVTTSIIDNESIDTRYIDAGIDIDERSSNIKNVTIPSNDLEELYKKIIIDNLNGFAPKRSYKKVAESIINVLNYYLGLKLQGQGIDKIKEIVVNNEEIFSNIISESVEMYRILHNLEVEAKTSEDFNDNWEIPKESFYTDNVEERHINMSVYQPLYLPKKLGKIVRLEEDFIRFLESKDDYIEWFWKNGDKGKSNFGIKMDESTFYPDFIIKFKDGRVGIFDTKAERS